MHASYYLYTDTGDSKKEQEEKESQMLFFK